MASKTDSSQDCSGRGVNRAIQNPLQLDLAAVRARDICPYCCHLDDSVKSSSFGNEIFETAKTCELCKILLQGCKRLVARALKKKLEGPYFEYERENEKIRGQLAVGFFENPIPIRAINQKLDDAMEIFVEEGHARHAPEFALDSGALDRAHHWLNICLEEHPSQECPKYTESELPTRVIDVGLDGAEPFLSTAHGPEKLAKYLALSYCWGMPVPVQLKQGTLSGMEDRIELDSLPGTIRDAILVARAFRIQYLWVDALCIIQDSKDDWARESSRMGNIFANAYFVISAEAALDCTSGFLQREKSALRKESSIVVQCMEGDVPTTCEFFMRRQAREHWAFVVHSSSRNISRLSTRGWAFQERFLARRKLIFGADETGWECASSVACECRVTRDCQSTVKDYFTNWRQAIGSYTGLQLTKSSDRLPGFSGIASTYQHSSELYKTYIGGMWKECLPWDLMWSVGETNSERHANYCAPTWSWASVTGDINAAYFHEKSEQKGLNFSRFAIEIIGVDWKLASINPFGPVSEGLIVCRGPVSFAKLVGTKVKRQLRVHLYHNLKQGGPKLPPLTYSEKRDGRKHPGFAPVDAKAPSHGWVIDGGFYADVKAKEVSGINFNERHLFLICMQPTEEHDYECQGLILRKSRVRHTTDFLERVGLCSFVIDRTQTRGWSGSYWTGEDKEAVAFQSFLASSPRKTLTIV